MSATDWKATTYEETFGNTLRSLERRRVEDPAFSRGDAMGVLKHLYVQDGNDWGGRGELQDIVMQATLDAYERFLAEWAASVDPNGPRA